MVHIITFPCSSVVEQSTVNRWVVGSNPTGGAFIEKASFMLVFSMKRFLGRVSVRFMLGINFYERSDYKIMRSVNPTGEHRKISL